MTFKPIFRVEPHRNYLRMFCLIWQRGEWGQKDAAGRCVPYSFKLTFGLQPQIFAFRRETDQIRAAFLGLTMNYHWSCGGAFV